MGVLTEYAEGSAKMMETSSPNFKDRVIKESVEVFEENYGGEDAGLAKMFESEDPREQFRAAATVRMMENTRLREQQYKDKYTETYNRVIQQSLGDLNKSLVDVVRSFYPNQIANYLVDLYPMQTVFGQYAVKTAIYSDTYGGVTAGQDIFTNSATNYNYASEKVVGETMDTGDGTTLSFTGTLSYEPIRPGVEITVTIGGETYTITDACAVNGAETGVLTSSDGMLAGSSSTQNFIKYTDGTYNITFDTGNTPDDSTDITINYSYDYEQDDTKHRDIEFKLVWHDIKAEPHTLTAGWSNQAEIIARDNIGMEVGVDLSMDAAEFIKKERDEQVVNMIANNATAASTLNFDASTSSLNITKQERYAEIELKLDEGTNLIQGNKGRGGVDFILAGANAANIWAKVPGFVPEPRQPQIGSYRIGTLAGGSINVVKSFQLDDDNYIIGYKGYQMGDSSTVLAEYIPLFITDSIQQPELYKKQGFLSMYALKYLQEGSASYYYSGTVSNYEA